MKNEKKANILLFLGLVSLIGIVVLNVSSEPIFTFDENTTYLFTAVVYESREDFLNNASFWIV